MGVYWAKAAAKEFPEQVEIIDLRTIHPLDEQAIFIAVRKCNRCLVLTEEPTQNSFAQSISGLISEHCFTSLDAPVMTLGSECLPAIPLNSILEHTMLPNAEKVAKKIGKNRSTIANLLRLRSLPQEIKDSLVSEKISMGHARALLGGGTQENQLYLFKQVLEKGLSVRETERLVNQAKQEPKKLAEKMSAHEKRFLEAASTQIATRIKSSVKIKKTGDQGRIEINFKSKSEFDRLVVLLSHIS